MQVTIQGKQIDLGQALRTHIEDKLQDINAKFFNHATFTTVILSREGHGHGLVKTHIQFQVGRNIQVMADALEGEAHLSFDTAAEKLLQQLRKYKKRLRDHHDRQDKAALANMMSAREQVLGSDHGHDDEAEEADGPAIIAEMTTNVETMCVRDAVMRMDLAGLPALLFRNRSHDGLNMVYRRPDGHVGWIDPSGNELNLAPAVDGHDRLQAGGRA